MEGDSAGGSAVDARDRSFQAILPLRGKIINVEKARINKVLSNNEIQAMITAIGTGIGEEMDVDRARYHKIVLTCDADVDGAHIRTLILTFLFRHMKELIEAGYVYIAQPPLYRLKVGSDERYFEKEHQLEDWLVRERLDKITITDRSGQSIKLTEARLQRLQRAVKEYEGWGWKLKEMYGNEVVGYVKDNRMIETDINDVAALEKYFREQVHADELHRVEIAEVDGRRGRGQGVREVDRRRAHLVVPARTVPVARVPQPAGDLPPADGSHRRAAVHAADEQADGDRADVRGVPARAARAGAGGAATCSGSRDSAR